MKVIDLINKIANREIKRGTIIKFGEMEFLYDYPNLAGIYRVGMHSTAQNNLFYFLDSTNLDKEVELIEEEPDIDIQDIKETDITVAIKNLTDNEFRLLGDIRKNQYKINELIQAIKQLDRQINNN